MKLTMRKKIALLGVIFIIFLAIFLTIVFVNNRKNPSPTHQQKGQKSLSQAKQSVISEIKSQLNNKLDGVSNLLAEMKKEKMLKADENDWEKYFDLSEINSANKLEEHKKKVLDIVNKLSPKTPTPGPGNPSPGPGNPSPGPGNPSPGPGNPSPDPGNPSPGPAPTPPTNKWEKVLWEVSNFLNTNPSSDKIKKWSGDKRNEIGDPLNEIDLKGANRSTLLGLSKGSSESEIAGKAQGKGEIWKNHYTSLSSVGDGNCFLNSFAILLTGSQASDPSKETSGTQQNVATRLRATLCLELMEKYDSTELNNLKWFADNHNALATDHCRFMQKILKRPVISVYKDSESYALGKSPATGGILWNLYDDGKQGRTLSYQEPFVVYHVGSFHFEPLVCKSEGGIVSFNYSRWDFEDENNSSGQRSIVFDLNSGTLKRKSYSSAIEQNIPSKTRVRVLYNRNDSRAENEFNGGRDENKENDGTKKINRNIVINVVETSKIRENGNEIIIDYGNFYEMALVN